MKETYWDIETPLLRCRLAALGAAIARVQVRDAGGRFVDVALPAAGGPNDPSLAGRTVGPCCGRVRRGEILLNGAAVALSQNEGENHLHGGRGGCAFQVWDARRLSPAAVRFELRLPDGLDGYPGRREIAAEYRASGARLTVVYTARTDRPTWMGLTNHVYWDLGGRFDGSALDQRLWIAAGRVVFNDAAHLPVAIRQADGPYDFREFAPLRPRIDGGHPQLAIGRGYNNAFLLDAPGACQTPCARLASDLSGISMSMYTDQPAVVLYSGGFLDAATPLRNGVAACPGCALALEAQAVPDPFHLPGAAPEILLPGGEYRRSISWAFDAGDPGQGARGGFSLPWND